MRLIFLSVICLITLPVFGQDIIVRITGDTLHVKIESTSSTFVYYKSVETKGSSTDVISRKEIAEILYGFEEPDPRLRKITNRALRGYDVIQAWATLTGQYLPAEESESQVLKEYYDELQWGLGFQAGVNYFFRQEVGVGLFYANTRFKNSIPLNIFIPGVAGNISDDLRLQYIGAGIVMRFGLANSSTNFSLSAGAGINYYFNHAEFLYAYTLEGNDAGFHVDSSMNLSLGGGLFLPVKLSYIGNYVGDLHFKPDASMPDALKNEFEDLVNNSADFSVTRFSLCVGLMFSF